MPDRTINFGDSETDARYRIQDTSSTGGDFVLAEDLDGGTVLLEYDYSAGEFVSRGSVNLSGNDITNAGSISADTLEAGGADTRFDWINETDSGVVPAGNFAPIWTTTLNDGETLNVTQAALSLNDGSATPADCDLVIADLTNMTEETELITSDGTLQIDATGTPLGSYQNTSGSSEQVAVGINNGEFGAAGSGDDRNARVSFSGRVV